MVETHVEAEKCDTTTLLNVDTKKEDSMEMREDSFVRGESETTEYDISTDDESLRLFFSSAEQSASCSEICSRRSSSVSQVGFLAPHEDEVFRSTEDLVDMKSRMKLLEKRRKMFKQKQSVSLDCA